MHIRRPMCFLALVFMLFVFIVTEAMGGVDVRTYCNDFTKVTVIGEIKDKAYKNDKNILYLEDAVVEGNDYGKPQNNTKSGIIVYLESQDIDMFKLGQQAIIEGKYSNFTLPENEGEFNMRKYYRIHGFEASITNAEVTAVTGRYGKIRSALNDIRSKTKALFFENMSDTNAGTLSAMVLGDKTELEADVKELYQRAGMAHMLAMSGLHIASVGLFLFSFIRRIGVPLTPAAGVSSIIMVLYGMMTGMSTSTFRALIMFLLGVIAKCIGRTYDLMSAVCLSAIIILIENPFFIYDSGFLMSVLSVTGIGIIYPELTGCLERLFGGSNIGKAVASSKITTGLCISISTTLATLPVVMNSFFKISRYGIFANLIVVPLMGIVLFIGLITGILNMTMAGMPFGIGIKAEWIYHPLFLVCEKILDLYNYIAGMVSGLDGNSFVTGKAEWWNIVLYVSLMVAFGALGRNGIFSDRKRAIPDKNIVGHNAWKQIYLIEMVRICILILAVGMLLYTPKPNMRINVLYVGQGACNVIYGKDIPTIMIDGGSTDVKDVYKYKVKPNLLSSGISKIDYLFVTHPDEDHISAIRDLINDESREIKADKVVLSIVDENVRKKLIKNDDADNRTPIYQMNAGQKIEGKKYIIEAISPEYVKGSSWDKVDANEASLVLKVTHKPTRFSALFTGDIDSETEKKIISNQNANVKNISFVTIPHHGSRNSSCEEFLKITNPKICTISAGKHNSYGHPHKETLERLDKFAPKSKVLRTDESGQIMVTVIGDRISISKFISR